MYRLSLRHCQLIIRLGLALSFLWFGINLFIQPEYWLAAWFPQGVGGLAGSIGMGTTNAVFLIGMFDILVAVSLVTGFFARSFATIAICFLVAIVALHGIDAITILMLQGIAGLAAIMLWPEHTYI